MQHFGTGGLGRCHHHVAAGGFAGSAPDGLAPHGNRLGAFIRLGPEAVHDLDFDVLFGVALDVLHEAFLVQADQAHGSAIGTGAPGAADAVHVVFAHVGDIVVHHVRQVVDVDAACRNVGCHQGADVAALEPAQCLRARRLALVAMQGHGVDTVFGQEFGHVVGAELGAREDQNLAPVVLLDDVRQQRLFLAAPDRVDGLRDALYRGVAWGHLHALRVFQQRGREVAYFIAEGGREQQALFLFRHCRQHLFHVVDEAHVQHAVGFIEHQHLDLAQIEHPLAEQIEQAPGCGDQNIHAFLDAADLRVHADAAKNDGGGKLQEFAVGLYRLLYLGREFAGRGQHQGADAGTAEFVLGAAAHAQFVQHGQHERCGFAGAGLGAAEQIVPVEHYRNSLGLYGRGGFVALLAHGLDNGRGQFQIFKVHNVAPVQGAWHVNPSRCLDTGPVKGRQSTKTERTARGLGPQQVLLSQAAGGPQWAALSHGRWTRRHLCGERAKVPFFGNLLGGTPQARFMGENAGLVRACVRSMRPGPVAAAGGCASNGSK